MRSTLVRIEVDEVTLVYRRPGWLFIGEPSELRVFVLADSTLYLYDESTDRRNSFIGCAIRSGLEYAYIPDNLSERYLLIAFLLTKSPVHGMGEISTAGWHILDNQDLDIRVRRTIPTRWLALILMGFLTGLLRGAVWDSHWKSLVAGTGLAFCIAGIIERLRIPWGPAVGFNDEKISRRLFGREVSLEVARVEEVLVRDRLWRGEELTLIGPETRIRLRSTLPRYEEILRRIRRLRPELFGRLKREIPAKLPCMVFSFRWILAGLVMASSFLFALFGQAVTSSFDPTGYTTFFISLTLGLAALVVLVFVSPLHCSVRDDEIVVKHPMSSEIYPVSALETIVFKNGRNHERKIVLSFDNMITEIEIHRSRKTPPLRILHEALCARFPQAKTAIEGTGVDVTRPTPLEQLQSQLAELDALASTAASGNSPAEANRPES